MKDESKVVNLNKIKADKKNEELKTVTSNLLQDLFNAGSIAFLLSFNLDFKKTGKYNYFRIIDKEIEKYYLNSLLYSCTISRLSQRNTFENAWENIQTFPKYVDAKLPNCEHFDFGILGYFDPMSTSIYIQLFTDLKNLNAFQKRKLYKDILKMDSICEGTLSLLGKNLIPHKFKSFFYDSSIRHSNSPALLSNFLLVFYQDRLTTCDYFKLKQLCDKYDFLYFNFENYKKEHEPKPILRLLKS